MKRRSFIQGVLAIVGATVAAKMLPLNEPLPQFRTYYMNQFMVGERAPELIAVTSPTNQFNYRCLGYDLKQYVPPIKTFDGETWSAQGSVHERYF